MGWCAGRASWGWSPAGRGEVQDKVGPTSLDRSHGDPPPYRDRAIGQHDETKPTANSARSSSRSNRSTICGRRGEHPMKTADIEYRDGALTCRGFLAYDETKTGRRPGVLVVHEAFGLGKHAMDRAIMLVELGYVAFAADMFGDRMQVTELPKAIEIITDLLGNPPKLLARADAALEVLRQRPEVDAPRLGGIGFCFGGSYQLPRAPSGRDLKGGARFP